MDLRWTPPASDGGSPVTGYVIEKREKGSTRWTKAGESKGPDCKGTAENLEEGVTYEFRVRAVNVAGPGEPNQASKPITAKPRKRKSFSQEDLIINFEILSVDHFNWEDHLFSLVMYCVIN